MDTTQHKNQTGTDVHDTPATKITAGNLDIGAYTLTVNDIEIVDADGQVNKSAVEDSGNWDSAYSHISADGSSHSYIDQSVVSGSAPTFTGTNFTGIPDGALSSSYLLADGSRDLTSDWTIATNNVTLTAGAFTAPTINTVIYIDGTTYPRTTAGIESALAAGGAGTKIIMTEGTYVIDSQIDITLDNIILEGVGFGTYLLGNGGAGAIGHGIYVTGDNVTLRDFWIDGNSISINYCIVSTANEYFRAEGLKVGNCRTDGIVFGPNMTDGIAINNYVYDCFDPDSSGDHTAGIEIEDGALRILITNNIIENCLTGIYPHTHIGETPIEDITISNNILLAGVDGNSGLYITNGAITGTSRGIKVIGNTLTGGGMKFTANADGKVQILVSNNTISDFTVSSIYNNSIVTDANIELTIKNNVITNGSAYGIDIRCPYTIIEGNTFELCGIGGIYLGTGSDYSIVNNNIIRNNGQTGYSYGIDVLSPNATISNNLIYDDRDTELQDNAIRIRDNADNCIITNNTTYGNVNKSLWVNAPAENVYIANNLFTEDTYILSTSIVEKTFLNGAYSIDCTSFSIKDGGSIIANSAGNDKTLTLSHDDTDGQILTNSGLLKLQSNALNDVELFGDADVGNDDDGKKLTIKRKAAEGDQQVDLYISDTGAATIANTGSPAKELRFEPENGGVSFLGAGNAGMFAFRDSAGADMFRFRWDSALDQTNLAISNTSGNHINFTYGDYQAVDHDHAIQGNTTLYMQGRINPNVSNNMWGSIHHDQTGFVLTSGANTGAGTTPLTIDNSISFQPRGTESGRFDSDATAGNTRFMLYDVDNGTMERVSVGIADSGGAGYKVLRIAN